MITQTPNREANESFSCTVSLDSVRHRIDLGTETYATGKMAYERVDELCRYLNEFTKIMKGYKVSEYKAYGTSAIRETENTIIILDQIRQRTGIEIEVLSNSSEIFQISS